MVDSKSKVVFHQFLRVCRRVVEEKFLVILSLYVSRL